MAGVHRVAGRVAAASQLLDDSLEIRQGLGDRRSIGMTVINQALVAAADDDPEKADRLLREALLLFEETEDGPGRWGALLDLGLVLLDAGDDERARRVLREWQGPPPAWTFRPRAWALLSLAAAERRCGTTKQPSAASTKRARPSLPLRTRQDSPTWNRLDGLDGLDGLDSPDGQAEALLSEC